MALGLAWQRSGQEAHSALERIELEANRLNELIGRLLTLARLEGGEDAMHRTAISLDELVQDITLDADFEAQSRQCRVRCEVEEEMTVFGSASLLHSAIENVVRNAMRHTREGSEVEIRLARGTDHAEPEAIIRVTDHGPGVPKESLDKLFRPFYRLDDARGRQTGGVGLGVGDYVAGSSTTWRNGTRIKSSGRRIDGGVAVATGTGGYREIPFGRPSKNPRSNRLDFPF